MVLKRVVGLGNRRGAERVGFDHVGAGHQVLPVNVGDLVGLRDDQEIVVALEVLRMVNKLGAWPLDALPSSPTSGGSAHERSARDIPPRVNASAYLESRPL